MVSSFLVAFVLSGSGQVMALTPPVERVKVGMDKATVEKMLGEKAVEGLSYPGIWNAVSFITHDYPKNRVSITYDATDQVTQIMKWGNSAPTPMPDDTPASRIKPGMLKTDVEKMLGGKGEKTEEVSYSGVWDGNSHKYEYAKNRVSVTYDVKDRVRWVTKWSSPAPKPSGTSAKPEK